MASPEPAPSVPTPGAAPPWTPEREVDAGRARRLVEAACPELAPVRVRPLGAGWDNAAWLATGADGLERVFRFPRRALAVELLATETALLPALAPELPLAVPVPDRHGLDGGEPPWPFSGYPRLPGRTACALEPDPAGRGRLAEPLAELLVALHAFPAERARALGVPPDRLGRLDVAGRRAAFAERLARLAPELDARTVRAAEEVLARAPAGPGGAEDGAEPPRLVHGDLYARHVLVDGRGAPCGVIDWGDAHLGDPAVDLAVAPLVLPARDQARFRARYEAGAGRGIEDASWRRARWRALHHALVEIDYGRAVGDRALERAGRAALGHLAEDTCA